MILEYLYIYILNLNYFYECLLGITRNLWVINIFKLFTEVTFSFDFHNIFMIIYLLFYLKIIIIIFNYLYIKNILNIIPFTNIILKNIFQIYISILSMR